MDKTSQNKKLGIGFAIGIAVGILVYKIVMSFLA